MQIKSLKITDPGLKKQVNEDYVITDDANHLYLLSDGMGGETRGTLASRLTCELVHQKFLENIDDLKELMKKKSPENQSKIKAQWAEIVNEASKEIRLKTKENSNLKGMASTLTLLWFYSNQVYIGHVGDSRAYLYRHGAVHQLTDDHTFGQQEINQGRSGKIAKANALTQAIGFSKVIRVDHLLLELEDEDTFILCSDGLSDHLIESDLMKILEKDVSISNYAQLVELAKQKGGRDNISFITTHISCSDNAIFSSTKKFQSLKVLPFFEQLNYAEIAKVMEIAITREFTQNSIVLKEGDVGRSFYVVMRGEVEIIKEENVLASFKAGDYFGEMALIDGKPRSADVKAVGDVTLLELNHKHFFELVKQSPGLGVKILYNFNKRLSKIVRSSSKSTNTSIGEFSFIDV